MAEFTARAEQYPLLGALGRVVSKADEFARKPFGYENPPAAMISDLLQIPALTRTVENINYGSPLTYGTGTARQLTKDTKGAIEGALNLAPAAGPLVRATKNIPIGMVVKPVGNLNLRPSVLASQLKGPEKQKVGDFIKQINGMKGLTKEGKEGALASLKKMDQNAVVTKDYVENAFEPSKYNIVDLKGAASSDMEHLHFEALNEILNEESFWKAIAEQMGLSADSDAWKQIKKVYERSSAGQSSTARGLSPEVRDAFEDMGMFDGNRIDGDALEMFVDDPLHELATARAELMAGTPADDYVYRSYQRLFPEADYLPEQIKGQYMEFGVAHPDAPGYYRHFDLSEEPLTAHVRGTTNADYALLPDDTDLTLDPNSFLIEELQSDAAKKAGTAGVLHQPHATAFKAAIQKALELGNDTVYMPTARTIATVRGKRDESFAPIYDQEVVRHGIEPLSRIEGVVVEPVMFDDVNMKTMERYPVQAYHKIKISPEARQEILEGQGQSLPGFAGGGSVDVPAFDPGASLMYAMSRYGVK